MSPMMKKLNEMKIQQAKQARKEARGVVLNYIGGGLLTVLTLVMFYGLFCLCAIADQAVM